MSLRRESRFGDEQKLGKKPKKKQKLIPISLHEALTRPERSDLKYTGGMALKQLLTHFAEADAGALETLKLNPGIINDPWVGVGFVVNNVHIFPGDAAIMVVSQSGSEGLVRELVRLGVNVNSRTGKFKLGQRG